MDIRIKASIELSKEDLNKAIETYVSQNGFDLTGKSFEVTLRAEGAVISVDTDSPTPEVKPEVKKTRQPRPVIPPVVEEAETTEVEADPAFGQEALDSPKEKEAAPPQKKPIASIFG